MNDLDIFSRFFLIMVYTQERKEPLSHTVKHERAMLRHLFGLGGEGDFAAIRLAPPHACAARNGKDRGAEIISARRVGGQEIQPFANDRAFIDATTAVKDEDLGAHVEDADANAIGP